MKNIRCIVSTISVVMVLGLNISGNAQTPEEWEQKERVWKQKAADAYVFPIQPGTAEWLALESTQARVNVCQIPEDILKTISTEGLVETCLNYPFLGDIIVVDSYQQGLERMIPLFNGLQELMQRHDAGIVLVERYKTIDPEHEYHKWIGRDENPLILHLLYLEVLVAYDPIFSKIPQQIKISLLQESLRVYQAKQHCQIYKGTLNTSVFIMARILEHVNYLPLHQRIAQIERKDAETLRQEILQKWPEMRHMYFLPIPESGLERYQQFLRSGGMGGSPEVFYAVVLSAEQYLSE